PEVVRLLPGELVEVFQYPVLHLLGGLVGEGDGENMTEVLRLVLKGKLQVCLGERARLTGTRGTSVDGERGLHRGKEKGFTRQLLSIAVKLPRIIQVDRKGNGTDFTYRK